MIDLGKVTPGSTVVVPFHTFDSNDPSASVAIAAFVVGDIEVYRDGDITAGAERSSDTGFTLIDTDGIDLDGIVGIGGATIDLSSNADAGFWRAGSQYTVIIGPVTIDAAVVNFIPVTFKIGYDGAFRETVIESVTSQTALVLAAGVAPPDDDAFNGCRAIIHDVSTADQWAFVDVIDYTASSRTVTLAAGAIFTVVATDNISFFPPALHAARQTVLDDWIDAGRLDAILDLAATAAALATVDGIVDAILLDTTEIGTAGAGLNNIDLPNQTMDITGDITGNLSGSVGSVTGAVGSVTGAVGSVTGAVGSIAAGGIVAGSYAAGARDAAGQATDAVDEIRDAMLPTQNVAFNFKYVWVAASDHVTPVTGASTTSVTRSLDGAAFTAATGTLSEIANGLYRFVASAADMNAGEVTFRFVATGGTPGAPDDAFVHITTGGGV